MSALRDDREHILDVPSHTCRLEQVEVACPGFDLQRVLAVTLAEGSRIEVAHAKVLHQGVAEVRVFPYTSKSRYALVRLAEQPHECIRLILEDVDDLLREKMHGGEV